MAKYVFMFFLIAGGLVAHAETVENKQSEQHKSVLSDTPRLQSLLREEMLALQKAIHEIVLALPRGEWSVVAINAKAIHDSFIFQQQLTAKDREILHHKLPLDFIRLDQEFHQRAKGLHDAALQQDAELGVFYLSRMLESCLQCHQNYATNRFPNLKEISRHAPHH